MNRKMQEMADKYGLEVVPFKGVYVRIAPHKRTMIADAAGPCSVEEYAARQFRKQGFNAFVTWNATFQVLFAVYMYSVIQDPTDIHSRVIGFPDRKAFDAGLRGTVIWSRLPDDFGTREYALRRADAIKKHLAILTRESRGLQDLFDLWLGPSENLRQYLWVHRDEHLQVGRSIVGVVPRSALIEILRYLAEDYWQRRSGWPDLLVYQKNEFFLSEVITEHGNIGRNKERWIVDCQEKLRIPFKLVEIGKEAVLASSAQAA